MLSLCPETFLLFQGASDPHLQEWIYEQSLALGEDEDPERLLGPIRVERAELLGELARVTLHAPAPLPRGRRTCELIEFDAAGDDASGDDGDEGTGDDASGGDGDEGAGDDDGGDTPDGDDGETPPAT